MSKVVKGKEAWEIYNDTNIEDYFVHSERDGFYWKEIFHIDNLTYTFYINDLDSSEIILEIE